MQTQQTKTQGKTDPHKLQKRLDELKALRDEISVKIHLAEMDARDEFHKIEPALDKAEHEVAHLGRGAAGAVDKAEREVTHLAKGAAGAIDKAEREVTHLAKDAVGAVDKAEREVTHMAKDAAGAVARTLDSLATSLRKIRARVPK